MATENGKAMIQVAQKEEWKQPEITKLDINETKSSALAGATEDLTYHTS